MCPGTCACSPGRWSGASFSPRYSSGERTSTSPVLVPAEARTSSRSARISGRSSARVRSAGPGPLVRGRSGRRGSEPLPPWGRVAGPAPPALATAGRRWPPSAARPGRPAGPAPCGDRPPGRTGGVPGETLHQRGLTDSGLTADQDDLAPPGRAELERRTQRRESVGPLVELAADIGQRTQPPHTQMVANRITRFKPNRPGQHTDDYRAARPVQVSTCPRWFDFGAPTRSATALPDRPGISRL